MRVRFSPAAALEHAKRLRTSSTLRSWKVPLKSVSATVTGDIDLRGFVGVGDSKVGMEEVSVDIALDAPDASDEQLQALKGAVDAHCLLVETIRNPLQIETIFKKVEPKSAKAVDAELKDGILARIAASRMMKMPSR